MKVDVTSQQAGVHPIAPCRGRVPRGGHELPPLPYPYEALEPIIDQETLRIHHDRLHLSYVEGLNRAELALVESRARLDFSIVRYWERELAYSGVLSPCWW